MNLVALQFPERVEEEQVETQTTSLGPMLGRLAKRMRVKQTDLARKTQISRISVNRFFRGKSEVRASDLVQVLKELGIDLEAQIRQKLND